MIKAEHKRWARLIFNPYIDRLLKKNFSNFYLLNEVPEIDKSAGLIITPNHFSWWDGFTVDLISRKIIHRKMHIMMLENQLRKYWFFKKVGAYSVNNENYVSMLRTLNYTREILASAENLVVLFPQGEIQPLNEKSIAVKEGLKILLDNEKQMIYVLPLAVKFEYGFNKKPDIVARFGNILDADKIKIDFSSFTAEFTNNIEKLISFTKFKNCRNILR